MADFYDVVTRLALDSDILRVNPNVLVQIFVSGTATLQWEGTADASGRFSVPTLPSGKYDIKVGGALVKTIHHVLADHTHQPDKTWTFFKSGAISGDQAEVNTMPIFVAPAAGEIVAIEAVIQSTDASGDVTVHLLSGGSAGGAALAIATDSVWNHRFNPGAGSNRLSFVDDDPGVLLAANDCLTMGIDYTTGTIAGLTVNVTFRPS